MIEELQNGNGWATWLIGFELGLATILLITLFWRRIKNHAPKNERFALTVLILLSALLSGSQFLCVGRPIYATGIFLPGSFLSRSFLPIVDAWLRRLIDPVLVCFFVGILELRTLAYAGRCKRFFSYTACAYVFMLTLELLLLEPDFRERITAFGYQASLVAFHYAIVQLFLCFFIFSLLSLYLNARADLHQLCFKSQLKIFVFGGLVLACIGLETRSVRGILLEDKAVIVGAHYYSWFPENWIAGFLGERLQPSVVPALGRYNSGDDELFAQHKSWAEEAGINLFIFDWWSKRPSVRKRIEKQVALFRSDENLKFALLYETLDLKDAGDRTIPNEDKNVVFFTPERSSRMARHWIHLAKRFMNDPSYLRIEGKPVLFLYATRHTLGPVREAVMYAREEVKKATGIELYLVADEVYFNVLDYQAAKGEYLLPDFQPNWDRLLAFDALTCYNAYDFSRPEHAGINGASSFFRDVSKLYSRYAAVAAAAGIEFIPGVLPGYNDRGVRLKENHFALSRTLPGEGTESFFARGLELLIGPYLSESRPFFAITSWNEWNEGTQIEPSAETLGPENPFDQAAEEYSNGAPYSGYGTAHLVELEKFLKSRETDRFQ